MPRNLESTKVTEKDGEANSFWENCYDWCCGNSSTINDVEDDDSTEIVEVDRAKEIGSCVVCDASFTKLINSNQYYYSSESERVVLYYVKNAATSSSHAIATGAASSKLEPNTVVAAEIKFLYPELLLPGMRCAQCMLQSILLAQLRVTMYNTIKNMMVADNLQMPLESFHPYSLSPKVKFLQVSEGGEQKYLRVLRRSSKANSSSTPIWSSSSIWSVESSQQNKDLVFLEASIDELRLTVDKKNGSLVRDRASGDEQQTWHLEVTQEKVPTDLHEDETEKPFVVYPYYIHISCIPNFTTRGEVRVLPNVKHYVCTIPTNTNDVVLDENRMVFSPSSPVSSTKIMEEKNEETNNLDDDDDDDEYSNDDYDYDPSILSRNSKPVDSSVAATQDETATVYQEDYQGVTITRDQLDERTKWIVTFCN